MLEEEPGDINQQIIQERQDLGRHLQELETRVDQATSMETYVRRNSGLFLGLAITGGVLLVFLAVSRYRR